MALVNSAATSTLGAGDIPPIAPPTAEPAVPCGISAADADGDAVAAGEAGLTEPFGDALVGPHAAETATRVMTSRVVAIAREGCLKPIGPLLNDRAFSRRCAGDAAGGTP
jgi:hypothetical protein